MIVELCDDPREADEFVQSHTPHLYYRSQWRSIIEEVFGHEHRYFVARDEAGAVRGMLPLVKLQSRLFGKQLCSLPFISYGGVVSDSEDARQALVRAAEKDARDKGVSQLTLRESEQLPMPGWACEDHKVLMQLTLPHDPDVLWKDIGSKRRAQVKRPQKEGANTKVGGRDLLDDFYRVFARNMRDLGTPVQSKTFFAKILETFPNNSHIVVVYLHEAPVAAAFLMRHGDEMEIPWASSLREANRFGVNMLLYWEVLKLSIEQGASVFDFGRSSKDSNTLRFKKQWGAQPKQLYWYSWSPSGEPAETLSPQDSKFALAISVWQKLPVSVANRIGPHVVKYLP